MGYHTKKIVDLTEKTICLLKQNPPAVMDGVDYLERPDKGWEVKDKYFTGVGYHGYEAANLNSNWWAAKAGLGHIPPDGYG